MIIYVKIKIINQINCLCVILKKVFCHNKKCKNCFTRSFASIPKSKFWAVSNDTEPSFVAKCSNKKYEFECECKHSFSMRASDITKGSQWCPYCSNQKLCGKKECIECYNKSFSSHDKSIFWSKNNGIDPILVFKKSNKKYEFNCNCGHTFSACLNNISAGCWCPYCAGQKLCDDENCIHCFNKSFVSHDKAEFWSSENKLSARDVTKKSIKKISLVQKCKKITI